MVKIPSHPRSQNFEIKQAIGPFLGLNSDPDLRTLHEHAFELIKSVISTFIVIRLKHFAKQENDRIKKNKVGHHHSILSLLCVLEQYLAQKYGVDYRLFKNLNISFFI